MAMKAMCKCILLQGSLCRALKSVVVKSDWYLFILCCLALEDLCYLVLLVSATQ